MATVVRRTDPMVQVLADMANNMKDYMMAELRLAQADIAAVSADGDINHTVAMVALGSHNDKSEVTITSDDPDDGEDDDGLQGALDLVNEITAVYTFHMADTLAHKVTGVALAAVTHVTTLAGAITRANDIKSKYETHRASTTYHYEADSTNTISANNATVLSDLITLLIELKADINLHMASGPTAKSIRVVDA